MRGEERFRPRREKGRGKKSAEEAEKSLRPESDGWGEKDGGKRFGARESRNGVILAA
jgi:hypothetical protein